jgi:anti-sigma factor RsiW
MISWRCWRLRPGLVDFAEGALAEPARARIERHLSTCARCAEAVLALREVPAEIRRRAPAEPPEEFWVRQRGAVLEAIDGRGRLLDVERATPAWPSRTVRWGAPVAVAASLAVALLASRWWTSTAGEPQPAGGAAVGAATTVARAEPPSRRAESSEQIPTLTDDGLFLEDTSLLGLADQLDDDGGESVEEILI